MKHQRSVLFIATAAVYLFYYTLSNFGGVYNFFAVHSPLGHKRIFETSNSDCTATKVDQGNSTWIKTDNFAAFSAYGKLDHTEYRIVILLGIRKVTSSDSTYCVLVYDGDDAESAETFSYWKSRCEFDLINVLTQSSYEAYYCICRYEEDFARRPNYVALTVDDSDIRNLSHLGVFNLPRLKIVENHRVGVSNEKLPILSICTSPIFDWTEVSLMRLFLDHYISQGALKFFLYKRSWSAEIEALVQEYRNFTQVIDWPLMPELGGVDVNNEFVHYRGQNLVINDCLWRTRNRSKFTLSIDLDEFFVLSNESRTIVDFLIHLSTSQPNIWGIVIRSRFVYLELDDFRAESKVYVENNIFQSGVRSKMIVRPEHIWKLGVHEVFEYDWAENSVAQLELPPHVGLINHLRECRNNSLKDGRFVKIRDILPSSI